MHSSSMSDTERSLEDMTWTIDDRDEWKEWESGISVQTAWHDDDDCVCIYTCTNVYMYIHLWIDI